MKKLFRRLFPSKEMRAYRKMRKRQRKELLKLAKETGVWDWSWLHDMVIMQVRHMYEYYTENNNVWQSDETRLPIIEQLKHVLDLNSEIDNLSEDIGIIDYKEFDKKERELYEELYSYIGKYLQWWWD
jgi:hypothetical protein